MYIHGSFINKVGDTITVHIVTNAAKTPEILIGDEASGLFFTADDPVTIDNQVNDTFDPSLKYQASVKLLTNQFIPDLFCPSARDAVINIYNGDTCVFAGFIEPQTYSQAYAEVLDEIDLNCVDPITALQYSKYKNIGAAKVDYDTVKAASKSRSFLDIVEEMLTALVSDLDIVGGHTIQCLYDGSRAVDETAANKYTILSQLFIHELLFLGDSEDDVWTQSDVLDEMLKFLNLHLVQFGFSFYLFDWQTVKGTDTIAWYDILTSKPATGIDHGKDITVDMNTAFGTDTKISIGEVFNQLQLTCETKSIESIIESPLDSTLLTPAYTNRQQYVIEYVEPASPNANAVANFGDMIKNRVSANDPDGYTTTWFLQVMTNKRWVFGAKGEDFIQKYCLNNANQQALPNALRDGPGCAILAMGKAKKDHKTDDNSPIPKIDMSNYLCIAINGNGIDDDDTKTSPSADDIKAQIPLATYKGAIGGGSLSPSDDQTTNYLVFSGDIILNPILQVTDTYKALADTADSDFAGKYLKKNVPGRGDGYGRYYAQQYFEAPSPNAAPTSSARTTGFVPFADDGPQLYNFKYSAIGDTGDHISKIAVLACMLIIGDKCLVETGTAGQTTDFAWQTYKTLAQCASEDEYYQQCFTLGFDPKIGDNLIGTQFSMQNNIDYLMNIDAEGIAVPIKKSDHLSGDVQFMILGPVNSTWDVVTRRHPTFFRHTKWSTTSVPLLAHTANILISSFEVKIYSDNGLINNTTDKDIIYLSDTDEKFVNKKDDIKFRINSALTLADCQALGVTNSIKLSNPTDNQGSGVTQIYDYVNKALVKPEKMYVDAYYKECHIPRVLLDQETKSIGADVNFLQHYVHPALPGRTFFALGVSRDLMAGSKEVNAKEIDI